MRFFCFIFTWLWTFAIWAEPASEEKHDGVSESDMQPDVYKAQIDALEAQVNDLKEQVFRSKARVAYLQSTVLSGNLAGAYVRVVHVNDIGAVFRLESVTHTLTKMDPWSLDDRDGRLSEKDEIQSYMGHFSPGNYTLSVRLVYRGRGFGVFSYLKNYVFNVVASYDFRVEDGRHMEIRAIGFDQGGLMKDLKERPKVRFELKYIGAESFQKEMGGAE